MVKNERYTERSNLFEPHAMITMVFSVVGVQKVQSIKQAFIQAITSNEMLNTKLQLQNDGKAYYKRTTYPCNTVDIKSGEWQKVRQKAHWHSHVRGGNVYHLSWYKGPYI